MSVSESCDFEEQEGLGVNGPAMKAFWCVYGWLFVRPRRWFFRNMIRNSSLRLMPQWCQYNECWRLPNVFWWLLYKSVFRLFRWFYWEAWCHLCTYENGFLSKKPLLAKIIHRVGATTAGYQISGGECFHCASPDGDPVDLSQDETETVFKLGETWSVATMDGTDHCFSGTTICPKCGYQQYYEDGSL